MFTHTVEQTHAGDLSYKENWCPRDLEQTSRVDIGGQYSKKLFTSESSTPVEHLYSGCAS
jgi:hypothetical protein